MYSADAPCTAVDVLGTDGRVVAVAWLPPELLHADSASVETSAPTHTVFLETNITFVLRATGAPETRPKRLGSFAQAAMRQRAPPSHRCRFSDRAHTERHHRRRHRRNAHCRLFEQLEDCRQRVVDLAHDGAPRRTEGGAARRALPLHSRDRGRGMPHA